MGSNFEIWKDIPGFEGYYQVSNQGHIKSLDRINHLGHKYKARYMSLRPNTYGHLHVTLHKDGKHYTKRVHQLVAEVFIGPCPDGLEVLHGPLGKNVNCVTNLSYDTRSENQLNRRRDGTSSGKPIVCEDGTKYSSITEAALAINVTHPALSKALRQGSQCVGLFWEYVCQ